MQSPLEYETEDCRQICNDCSDSPVSAEFSISVKRKQQNDKGRVDSTIHGPLLPPCRICGGNASGFHYGANTCEACKAFFRRCLSKGTQYDCATGETCELLPGKRNLCPACRLKKCISIGMSKAAIKTGRYTHAKKARDIMEVRGFREQLIVFPDSGPPDADIRGRSKWHRSTGPPIGRRPPTPLMSADELDEIIQQIATTHARVNPWTPDVLQKRAESEKLYMEQRALQQQIFGPLKHVTEEEYLRIYRSTGIDIDGRRDVLQSGVVNHIEECIKRHVMFVKAIPGFSRLPINDQTSLVKDDFDALSHTHEENEKLFQFQAQLQKLRLNEEENCILAAMCVLTTDQCELEDVDQILRCHSLMVQCFLRLMDKYHSDDPLFIARVIAVLVEMRTHSEIHNKIEEQVAREWVDKVDVPPLLFEMWSSL